MLRLALLAMLAGCAVGSAPQATLSLNGFTAQHAAMATPDSRIVVSTSWHDSCRARTPRIAGSYEGDHGGLDDCDPVRHRVHVRCRPCRITADDGHTEDDELTSGPGTATRTFVVTPLARTLDVEVTFEHGRERRVDRLPPVRFAQPDDVIIECGVGWSLKPCDRILTTDREQWLHVRATSDISLGNVRINDRRTALAGLALRELIATGDTGQLAPGDYPIVVDVGLPPDAIHRELTLHIR